MSLSHCHTCHNHERTSCGAEDCPCFSGDCEDWVEVLPAIHKLRSDYSVYPGQPLVCAAAIVTLFDSLEEAEAPSFDREGKRLGWCKAESSESPGAGGQNTKAITALQRYRDHRDMDLLMKELHEGWGNTVLHQEPYAPRYDDGMEKSRALEPALREALATWLPATEEDHAQ